MRYCRGFNVICFGIVLVVLCASVSAQEVTLPIDKEQKTRHGVSFKMPPGNSIGSIFDQSEIVSVSTDPKDKRNFGAYVEAKKEVSYEFKGSKRVDTIYIVYSNLSKILVAVGQKTDPKTIVGLSGGLGTNAYPDNADVFLYIYTKEPSPYLNLQTKNSSIEEDEVFWWSPMFLFGKQ